VPVGNPPRIDLLSPSSFVGGQPHDQFRWLRAHAPVYFHPEPAGPGFFALTRYEHVKAVGRDPGRFSSEPTILIPDPEDAGAFGGHKMMLTMDPPLHTRYRRLVVADFVPRAVARLRPRLEAMAAEIVDEVREQGACDLVEDVAGKMPSYVVAELLGIPRADACSLYRLTETIHAAPESQPEGAALGAVLEMFAYAHEVWERKRASPGADLSSRIAHAEVDGRPLDEIDFNLFFLLLVDAGGDTTRNLVAGGMHALFEHPAGLARLRADPDGLLPSALEELLRFVSPVVYMRRTATVDTVLGGQKIEAGQKVVMYYGSANRDEAVFEDPDRLDLARRPNEHVAFGGGGPHFCLGSHLARAETAAMLRALVLGLEDLEPAGPPEWLASSFVSGPKHLPVRFRPGPPRRAS
jgi:cytochrome P450